MLIAAVAMAVELPVPAEAQSKAAGVSCTALGPGRPAANSAERALWNREWEVAATEYQKLLSAHPEDPAAVAGLTRAYLAEWKNAEAATLVASVRAADSKSAPLVAAAGEVALQQGNVPAAWKLFVNAIQKDVCYPRAHFDMYKIMELSSMHASAYKQLKVANQLDPTDPDIYWAMDSTRSLEERIATVMRELGAKNISESDKARGERRLGYLQEQQEAARHHCHLVTPLTSAQVSMTPHANDVGQMGAWALDMSINKQSPVRLTIDTGASGILINRIAAEKAGLKSVVSTKISGIGDQGAVSGYMAYADSLRIGGMEFADCPVIVSDQRSVVGSSGLVGMDVFQDFMVTLDYPLRKFGLQPLPQNAATPAEPLALTSSVTPGQNATAMSDPYDGPEVKDFVPMYVAGESKLIINTQLNDATNKLMLIDTGSTGSDALFNSRVSPQFVKTTLDHSLRDSFRGLSGKVANVYTVGFVTMRYGKDLQMHLGGDPAIDLDSFSREVGMELAGFIADQGLYQLIIDIDYRDGLIRFRHDRRHGSNAW